MTSMHRKTRWTVASCILALGACSDGSLAHVIDDVRETQRPATLALGASSATRFGMGDPSRAGRPHRSGSSTPLHASSFGWELPPGWSELPPTPMRQANFGLSGRAECYLTILPGQAGGVLANLNRWRGQLGLEALTDLSDLETAEFLGASAYRVDLQGEYRGMGAAPEPDFRLVGLISEQAGKTVFLKMVGPQAELTRELEHFASLARSLHVTANEPRDHPPAESGAQGLHWDTPPGWRRGPERSMRLATFLFEDAPGSECALTLLQGDAGGVSANVDRWRSQMGRAPLAPAEHAALERRTVLETEATLVEVQGDFTGMSGEVVDGAALLGLIVPLGQQTLFVKLIGPADEVAAERERFAAFCASLR